MKRQQTKQPSQRQLKVGEEIRHALADELERDRLRDPELSGLMLTVTEVRASPDLRNASVYVMPLGGIDEARKKPVMAALQKASSYLRRKVGGAVHLRTVPTLTFIFDPSFDEAGHIEQLLKDPAVAQDLSPHKDQGNGQNT